MSVSKVPFMGLYDQFENFFSSLQVSGMKAVDHEDKEYNNDYSVDPLADPRLDKMDLYSMVDSVDRDKIMSASESFQSSDSDFLGASGDSVESSSDSGSGE